jgi:hypothetical protein
MAEKVGVFNRLFLSSGASDASYAELEFLEGSALGLSEQFLDSNGLVGSRSRPSERTRRGLRQAAGSLSFQPTPAELDLLLPWALGGAKSGNTVPLAETVPARWLRTARDGTFHLYDAVKVQQITFSASEGSPLGVQVQVVGVDEAASAVPGSFAALDLTGGPYVMHDCVLTVGGTAYPFRNWQLTLMNMVEVRHNNSVTPTAIHATGREVQAAVGLPYGDASALYGSALGGVAMVATFTNGSKSVAFTCPAVQAPRQPLELGTRAAITLSWVGTARKSGSTPELSVDNDVT